MKKSLVYKARRKLQILAYNILTPEIMSKIYFRIVLKKKLNLKNPKSFNEKLQWLKLYYWPECNDAVMCADKYRVREYLESKGFGEYLNELIGVWEKPEEIDWNSLPNQFVLKCNHGCGYNIICDDKNTLDEIDVKKRLKKWLKEDFGKYNAEPHYSKIQPKIICEKFLGSDIVNYNMYCCNGKLSFYTVVEGLGDSDSVSLQDYYADDTKTEFSSWKFPKSNVMLPKALSTMKELSSKVSADFPFVRIDFFEVNENVYFSELTFTPGGALIPFYPTEYDNELSKFLDVSCLLK